MIYIILIFVVWLGAALSVGEPKVEPYNWRLEFFMLISCFVIVIGGLRYEVGADWGSYLKIFNDSTLNDYTEIEPGYVLLNKIFKLLGAPYQLFLMCLFALSYSLKAYAFSKYSANVFIALLVYIPIQFMVYDINAIRQGLAIGVLFTTFPFILRRKLMPFLLICFLAISIHITSIVFLPFYWIALKPFSDRRVLYLLILFTIIALLSNIILNNILPFLGIDFVLFDKFLSYTANDSYNKQLSFNLSTIYRILILIIFIYMRGKMKIQNELYLLLRNGYFLSLAIYFTFFSIELIATRGSLYFRVFDTFMFTYIITSFRDLYMKQLLLFLLLLYVGLQIFVTLNIEDNSLIPYHNFLMTW